MKELCKDPVLLPERKLSQEETEAYWGEDRHSLVNCGNRLKARNKLSEGK